MKIWEFSGGTLEIFEENAGISVEIFGEQNGNFGRRN